MVLPTDRRHAAVLSFIAGYVDTLGFIGLFGLFTAHVTGNFVLLGRALVNPGQDVLLKLLVFPVFVAAIVVARLSILAWQRKDGAALRNALGMQLVLLAGCTVCGWLAGPASTPSSPLILASGMLGAAGMAVQNTYGKLLLKGIEATTVMTGNVTAMVIAIVDAVRGDVAARAQWRSLAWPLAGFTAGCAGGAVAYLALGFAGLVLPCALLVVLLLSTP